MRTIDVFKGRSSAGRFPMRATSADCTGVLAAPFDRGVPATGLGSTPRFFCDGKRETTLRTREASVPDVCSGPTLFCKRRGDQDERSYCLIERCSRAMHSLPHQFAPVDKDRLSVLMSCRPPRRTLCQKPWRGPFPFARSSPAAAGCAEGDQGVFQDARPVAARAVPGLSAMALRRTSLAVPR